MADFYQQTSVTIDGPWLLDSEQMTELDSIITEQWERLCDYREKKIERETEEKFPAEIESDYPKPEKKKDKEAIRGALQARIAQSYPNHYESLSVELSMSGAKKLSPNPSKRRLTMREQMNLK